MRYTHPLTPWHLQWAGLWPISTSFMTLSVSTRMNSCLSCSQLSRRLHSSRYSQRRVTFTPESESMAIQLLYIAAIWRTFRIFNHLSDLSTSHWTQCLALGQNHSGHDRQQPCKDASGGPTFGSNSSTLNLASPISC